MSEEKKGFPEVFAYEAYRKNFADLGARCPSDQVLATLVLASSVRQCAQSVCLLAEVAAGGATPNAAETGPGGIPIIR